MLICREQGIRAYIPDGCWGRYDRMRPAQRVMPGLQERHIFPSFPRWTTTYFSTRCIHMIGKWLTLNPLTWKICWVPNNASRWQVGFNSAFKGLIPENHNLLNPSCEKLSSQGISKFSLFRFCWFRYIIILGINLLLWSQRLDRLRHGSLVARSLILRFRIPPEAWISVSLSVVCCQAKVSDRGFWVWWWSLYNKEALAH